MSDHQFYKTELRTLQIRHKDNNEEFLRIVANMVGNLTNERDELRNKVGMLEHQILVLETDDDYDE
ncbi:hypothetical protein [Stenotrophomonas phage RAS14]